MTYRVREPSYEPEEPYLHYIHNGQSASVANIQHLTTLQNQQNQYYNEETPTSATTELHRYAQNADRFSTNPVRIFLNLNLNLKLNLKLNLGPWL
jgi:hypothetical protein